MTVFDIFLHIFLFWNLNLSLGLPRLAPWWWAVLAFDLGAVIGLAAERLEGGAE